MSARADVSDGKPSADGTDDERFSQIDDEVRSSVQDGTGDPLDAVRTAVEACPTGALSLREIEPPRSLGEALDRLR